MSLDELKKLTQDEQAIQYFTEMMKAVVETDDEVAHSREDDFRQRILELIAEGHADWTSLASFALKTSSLYFSRWCA